MNKNKANFASLTGEVVKLLEDPDGLTEKACDWEMQTCALIAMVNKVIDVLEDARTGMQNQKEVKELRNLKYNCAQIANIWGKLEEDVHKEMKNRKKNTIAGRLFTTFRPVWNVVMFGGDLPDNPGEAAEEVIKILKGYKDSNEKFVNGIAQYQIEAYMKDLILSGCQADWTNKWIKKKLAERD